MAINTWDANICEWHDQLMGYHGISATFDMMAFNHLIHSDYCDEEIIEIIPSH